LPFCSKRNSFLLTENSAKPHTKQSYKLGEDEEGRRVDILYSRMMDCHFGC